MNHYINLLEPSEIQYQNSASIPPVFKLVAVGGLVLVLGILGMRYSKLRATAAEGERLESTWNRIEKEVEAAKALNAKKIRLDRALTTLRGWPVSRHDWPENLDFLVDQAPISVQDLQFTSVFFDEQMLGMRNQVPGTSDSKNFPLKRQVTLTLRGKIRSDRPQRILPEYRRNLAEGGPQPSAIADVGLDNPVILMDAEGNPTGIAEFTFRIELEDREVKP